MVLTAKQSQALEAAAPVARAALRAAFSKQNAGVVPGNVRDSKQMQMARNMARQRGSMGAISNMPRAAATAKGIMPDSSRFHWSQTPASSNVIAPRGFGYYDAFAHNPAEAVTAMSVGPATPIQANTRASAATEQPNGTGPNDLGVTMVIIYPSNSEFQCKMFKGGAALTDPIKKTAFTSPQLVTSVPESAMVTRCSLQIRNVTQRLNQGGIVRSLRLTTGILEPQNSNDLLILAEHIRNHARTRTYSGSDMSENKQINCSVVDQVRATTFLNFGVYIDISDVPWYPGYPTATGTVSPFDLGLHNPTFTPIVFLLESFATTNEYEISIRTQFLAHYVQGTMLANLAISPPSVGDKLNPHRDHEENKGSALHDVETAIEGAGKWLWNHGGQILGGLGAAASFPKFGRAVGTGLGYAAKAAPFF